MIKYGDSTTLLEKIRILSNDNILKHFLEESYSLELFLFLLKNEKVDGIANLYEKLHSPKPKKSAFDRYIHRILDNNLIVTSKSHDKRVVTLALSPLVYERLQLSHILFRDMSPVVLNSLREDMKQIL